MNDAHRQRILVVDDDARVRALLTELLEDEGYQVLDRSGRRSSPHHRYY